MLSVSRTGTLDRRAPLTPADLTVIVPSVNGLASLMECVEALLVNVASDLELEIVVVDRCGEHVRRPVRLRDDRIKVIAVPPGTTIPRMREAGFRVAAGDVVAVIEDHVLVPEDWARQLLAAVAAGADVVGGSVRNGATESVVDWAAFLCEYSHLLPPLADGPAEVLTGNNVAYRRAVLQRHWDVVAAGRWEDHVHAAMRRNGARLVCRPDICVLHKMHYRVPEYLVQRYLYARAYAGMRAEEMTRSQRAFHAVGAAALPPVLLLRVVTRVMAKRCHGAELAQSLPLLVLFVAAWAVGEAVGYAAGPGDALSRVA